MWMCVCVSRSPLHSFSLCHFLRIHSKLICIYNCLVYVRPRLSLLFDLRVVVLLLSVFDAKDHVSAVLAFPPNALRCLHVVEGDVVTSSARALGMAPCMRVSFVHSARITTSNLSDHYHHCRMDTGLAVGFPMPSAYSWYTVMFSMQAM